MRFYSLVPAIVIFVGGTAIAQSRPDQTQPPIFLPDTRFWRFALEPARPPTIANKSVHCRESRDIGTARDEACCLLAAAGAGGPNARTLLTRALRISGEAGDTPGIALARVELAHLLYRQGDPLAAEATLLPARAYFTDHNDSQGLARYLSLQHLIRLDAKDRDPVPRLLASELTAGKPGMSLSPRLASWVALFDGYQVYVAKRADKAEETWRKAAEAGKADLLVEGLAWLAIAQALGDQAQAKNPKKPDFTAAFEALAKARLLFQVTQRPQGLAQAYLVEASLRFEGGDLDGARHLADLARKVFESRGLWAGVIQSELVRAVGEKRQGQTQQALSASDEAERLVQNQSDSWTNELGIQWKLSREQVARLARTAKQLTAVQHNPAAGSPARAVRQARVFYEWATELGHPYLELVATRVLGQSLAAEGQWNAAAVYSVQAEDLSNRLAKAVPLRKRLHEAAAVDYQYLAETGLNNEPFLSGDYTAFVSQIAELYSAVTSRFEKGSSDEKEFEEAITRLKELAAAVDEHRLRALTLFAKNRRSDSAEEIDRFFKALAAFLDFKRTLPLAFEEGRKEASKAQARSRQLKVVLDYMNGLEKAVVLRDERLLRGAVDQLASEIEQGSADEALLPAMLGGSAVKAPVNDRARSARASLADPSGARVENVVAGASSVLDGKQSLRGRRWGRILARLAGSGVQEAVTVEMMGGTQEQVAERESAIFRSLYASQIAFSTANKADFVELKDGRRTGELRATMRKDTGAYAWARVQGYMGTVMWVINSLSNWPVKEISAPSDLRRSVGSLVMSGLEVLEKDDLEWDEEEIKPLFGDFAFLSWAVKYPTLLLGLVGAAKDADALAVIMRSVQADMDGTSSPALTRHRSVKTSSPAAVPDAVLNDSDQRFLTTARDIAINLALYYIAAERYPEAVSQLRRLVGNASGRTGLDAYQFHYAMGLCYRRMNMASEELHSLAAAIEGCQRLRKAMPTRSLSLRVQNIRQLLMEEYLGALNRHGMSHEMAQAIWKYRQPALVPAAVVRRSGGSPDRNGSPELDRLKDLYDALAPGEVAAPVTAADIRSVLKMFDIADASLKPGDPTLNGLDLAADVIVDEISFDRQPTAGSSPPSRPIIANGELLLSYFVGTRGLYIVTIDEWGAARTHYRRVDYSVLEKLCKDFREGLSQRVAREKEAAALNDLLLGFMPELLGKRRLRILDDGPLQLIPFQALRPAASAPYLVDRFVIEYVSGAPRRGGPVEESGVPKKVLVIANPSGELKSSEQEALEITKRFDAASPLPLTGSAATISAVRDHLPKVGYVHFSTHAERNANQPNFSYLRLADPDRIYSVDLAGLDFGGKRVFLGACETLLAEPVLGDDIYGVADAFLAANAASVVATLWRIDQDASARFGSTFYEKLGNGANQPEALAATQRAFIAGQIGQEFSQPFFWAGFNYLAPLRFQRTPQVSRASRRPRKRAARSRVTKSANSASIAGERDEAVKMLHSAVERLDRLAAEIGEANQNLAEAQNNNTRIKSELEALTNENADQSQQIGKLFLELEAGKKAIAETEKLRKEMEEVRAALIDQARVTGTTASLSGIVDDRAGKRLAGATLTLVDKDSGRDAKPLVVITDEKGAYSFFTLPIGHRYQIKGSWMIQSTVDNGNSVTTESTSRSGETDEMVLLRDSRLDVKLKGEGHSSTTAPKDQKGKKKAGD